MTIIKNSNQLVYPFPVRFWLSAGLALFLTPNALSKDKHMTQQPISGAATVQNNPLAKAENKSEDTSHDEVDISKIKEKYWARGQESELGVVQNRLYSKAGKWGLGILGGFTNSDPFLNVRQAGISIGYHFNESNSLHLIGWKNFVSKSSALETFEENMRASTNNNPPKYYVGTEFRNSVIYGKLSFVGKSIIYYDLYLAGGLGMIATDNGKYPAPSAGVGQKIYLGKSFSFDVDYRLMFYREAIIEKVRPSQLGNEVGKRSNYNNVINLGFTFLFGAPSESFLREPSTLQETQ